MKPLNIILGNAPVNNGNLGCVALSYTSIYLIDKILSDAKIDYKLYLTDSGYYKAGLHSIRINEKDIPFEEIYHLIPIDLKAGVKNFLRGVSYARSIVKFQNSDYVLDIGQGDSFADIYGHRRFRSIDRIHKEAVIFNKPYCILPQTIGPFKAAEIRRRAVRSIANARMVMARDKQSFEFTRELVPLQHNLAEYIDLAFFLPYNPIDLDSNCVHVGLNISALLWHGGYTRNNQFGLKDEYKDIVCRIIEYFLDQTNVKIHLIPHVISYTQNNNIEDDYAVAESMVRKYQSEAIILPAKFKSPVEAKSYISSMDFFMGARMHSTIAAFSSGVPVVPMAYSRKFNGLFVDTLGYEHIVDLKVDSESDSFDKVQDFYKHRQMLKSEIEKADSSIIRERKKALINDLKTFFQI